MDLNENISLDKTFPSLKERSSWISAAEAFNLLNRTIFSNPNANLNSNAFGQVTGQSNAPARCSSR